MSVSIVIPCYNYANFIGDCLLSCVNQSYPAKEIIVVDDASKDESAVVVDKFISKYSADRVRLIRLRENGGYSHAKNEGIVASRGDYIVTIDADDMLLPDSLYTRRLVFDRHSTHKDPVDMVDGNAYNFSGTQDYDFVMKRLYKLSIQEGREKVHAQGVMLRRRVHCRFGLYDESLRSRSDNEMWFRLLKLCEIRRMHIDDPVAIYRRHKRSMVQFRRDNPGYNEEVTRALLMAKDKRSREGITKHNTRFLPA